MLCQRHWGKVLARYTSEHELVRDLPSHIYLTDTLTCKGDLHRICCPSFSTYPYYLRADHRNMDDS